MVRKTGSENMQQPKDKFHLLVISLAFLISLAPTTCFASVIEGIIFSRQGPVQDAVVQAFSDIPSLIAGKDGYTSVIGEKPGRYRLELPPGKYFFTARGKQGEQELFSYHGANPLPIDSEYNWLPFFTVEATQPVCQEGPSGVKGLITLKGKPVNRGTASVYPLDDPLFRGMGLLTNTLDFEGKFHFELAPGEYVIVARQRLGNLSMGPLQKGDLFCYPAANPVQIDPSQSCELEIPCYPRDNLQAVLDDAQSDPRGRKEPQRRDASLWDAKLLEATEMPVSLGLAPSALTGTVTDLASTPRPGLYVQAYPAKGFPLFQMHILRLITPHMATTDSEGRYRIDLQPGEYYLVAREKIGEAPVPLEYYGLYEGNFNHSINILPGATATEVDIPVARIMTDN